ncbi:MAG: ABC transporter permease [Candidatus Nanoarchaeia archaeon]
MKETTKAKLEKKIGVKESTKRSAPEKNNGASYNYYSVQWVSFKTIVYKEVNRIMRIWTQTLVPPTITITLYFLIFGTFIGERIGEVNGVSYMAFIIPGLIMMAVINNSYNNVVSSFFGAKFQKSIEELLVSSTSTLTIIMGYVVGGMFRGLAVGVLVTIISLLFNIFTIHNAFVLLTTVLLTSFMFSLGGLINSMFAKRFDDVMIVPTFLLLPLIYLGGVFFSINQLSGFWQVVAQFNPILYIINTFRYGFIGQSDVNIFFAYAMLILASAILFTIAYRLLDKGYGMRS